MNLFLRNLREVLVYAPEGATTGALTSEADIMASMLEPSSPKASGSDEEKRKPASRSQRGGENDDGGSDQRQGDGLSDARSAAGANQDEDDQDDRQENEEIEGDDDADSQDEGGADEDEDDGDPLDGIFDADDQEGDDQGESDTIDTSKLGDDLLLSVTVDGEDKEVTLGELKRRYAGESAIEGRLQKATEARTASVNTYNRLHQLSTAVLQEFGNVLFARTVEQPDESLRLTNPAKYLLDSDLYNKESQALQTMQARMQQMVAAVDQAHAENLQQIRIAASQKLKQIMPVLADPVKGPRVKEALISAAKEIGYTDADIAQCTDPLIFKTMALAARELNRQKAMKMKKVEEPTRTTKQSGTANRSAPVRAVREDQKTLQRARKTGSESDIIASMMVTPKRKPSR